MKNISKQVLALAATTMLGFGSIQGAIAGDGYYVKGEVGVSMPKKIAEQKLKKSAIFGIEGGYKMNENFRFGLGVNFANGMKFKDGALKDAKVNSIILETNAYYDIADFNGFTPYLTAGVGVARNKLKGVSISTSTSTTSSVSDSGKGRIGYKLVNNQVTAPGQSETKANVLSSSTTADSKSLKKTGFAWNVGLGAMYNISSDFGVDLAYRYRDLGKVKINDTDSKKLKSHNVTVGVVYKF
ncbi:outer membrane beta-barrel protein [Candidatus Bandiella numerosa]|uniref:outer membrane protein n=1 Tax=Candidatus Bandiella numerosa TaxID=2570586 RepID=UPI00249EF848|nr:outer membrane beta-barrel protein [Candidatus Bandiella numerosa]WHA05194.1 outer membrane beta-barrel protein [Candidatus Bandiella numerosa]